MRDQFARLKSRTGKLWCYTRSARECHVDMGRVHIILAESRSGSTLLQEYLDSHRDNTELGELFWRPIQGPSHRQINYMKCLMAHAETRAVGSKITFTQLVRRVEFSKFLLALRGARFIVIERENAVASALSLIAAQDAERYHSRHAVGGHRKIHVDPIELRLLINSRRVFRDLAISSLQLLKLPYVLTSYEALTSDRERVLTDLFDFLGLPPTETRSSLKKTGPPRVSDMVVNYPELEEYFRGSPEARFFE